MPGNNQQGAEYRGESQNKTGAMLGTYRRPTSCKRAGKTFFMIDEEEIIGYDALYDTFEKCKANVSWKASVASFVLHAPEEILKLEKELKDGTYREKKARHFTVLSPKERQILSIAFRDRVYQRSLNDNKVYPAMTKSFIYDNFACQKGKKLLINGKKVSTKGTDACRRRLKRFLRKFYAHHGTDGYIAQFDIHGYYPNMSHAYVERMFKAKLEPNVYERVRTVLRNQYEGDRGYNPGSQMIQIAGISALDGLDHYIKEQLHIRFYLRYMDDFVLIHNDRQVLESAKQKITDYLLAREFEINEKKTRIFPITDGLLFLGFQFRLTETGKVLMNINPKNVKAKRKNLRRMVAKSKRGLIPKESVDESYRSWRDHASKGNSFKLLQKMDKYYRYLWREDAESN